MQCLGPRSPCGQAGPLRLVTFRAAGDEAIAYIRAGKHLCGMLGHTLIYEAGIQFPKKTS